MIKTDNGHGSVAHSSQVPPYSTLILILKLEIMIVLLIDLSTFVDTTHIIINQRDCVFGCALSPLQYHEVSFPLYIGPPTSTLPAVLSMHACMLATSAESFNSLPLDPNNVKVSQFFLVPSKTYPLHGTILLVQISTCPLLGFHIIDVIQH